MKVGSRPSKWPGTKSGRSKWETAFPSRRRSRPISSRAGLRSPGRRVALRRVPALCVRLALNALDRPHALRRGPRRRCSASSGNRARTAPHGSFADGPTPPSVIPNRGLVSTWRRGAGPARSARPYPPRAGPAPRARHQPAGRSGGHARPEPRRVRATSRVPL